VASAHTWRRAAFATLLAGVVAYALAPSQALLVAVEGTALALLAGRVLNHPEARAAWLAVTVAMALWLAGDFRGGTAADTLYLGSYVFGYTGLIGLIVVAMPRPWRAWLVIDGLLIGLALGAYLAVLVHHSMGSAVPAWTLGGDLLLITTITVACSLCGWRPSLGWWLLMGGELLLAGLDVAGLSGHSIDALWVFGFVICCAAAWTKPGREPRVPQGWMSAVAPVIGGVAAVALLIHAGLVRDGALAVVLAGTALLAGICRGILLLNDNLAMLRRAQRDATTDKLTGLPNRRALIADLDGAEGDTLVFFDLDGFKEYNDAFGHHAGDALLQRQAPRLAAVGRAYRLGGDEFCVRLAGERDEDDPQVQAAVDALSERGDGFEIGASFGLVLLAGDPVEALRIADERMYARKRRRRAGQGGPARDVLLQVLAERNTRNDAVAALAGEVGRRLGLDAEELDVLMRAAELHDVGKVSVPDEILAKDGPLDAAELAVLRQHPVAGERILSVADSMRPVARLVRAAHERWDGSGYPDGLAGEAIPLGARIIAVCAAGPEERREGAGTRFDPQLAEVAANLDTVVSG
jgi:diguanylate cyclase (GGDEF)-like protein